MCSAMFGRAHFPCYNRFMSELAIRLSTFEGPLDLLLRLIEQEEIDIYNIPIHRITEQYLRRLELEELDPQSAAEFLLLATELLEIKSRMLLPDHQLKPVYSQDEDPRAQLLERLLTYRRVKVARELLFDLHEPQRLFSEEFLLELPSFDEKPLWMDPAILSEAYSRALRSMERFSEHAPKSFERFTKRNYSVSLKQRDILQLLTYISTVQFSSLLSASAPKGEWVASFLALLKLQQDQRIHLSQPELFSEITIEKRSR